MEASQSGTETRIPYPVQRKRIVSGIIVGLSGVTIVLYIVLHYCGKYRERHGITVGKVLAAVAQLCSIIAIALMAGWISENGADSSVSVSFAGIPQWKYNMSWHFLFAACFYLFFIWGESAIEFFTPPIAAIVQFLCLTVCVGSLVTLLRAAVVYKFEYNLPQLVTIHSWTGIGVVLALTGYLFSLLAGYCFPSIRQTLASSIAALRHTIMWLTVTAIVSGIMNYLPHTACYYVHARHDSYVHPSRNYQVMPDGCKYVNGVGVCVLLAGIFMALAFYNRLAPTTPEKTKTELKVLAEGGRQADDHTITCCLSWEDHADLDLHVQCPDGQLCHHERKQVHNSDGQLYCSLDVDKKADDSNQVENIFVLPKYAPPGEYVVKVQLFSKDGHFNSDGFVHAIRWESTFNNRGAPVTNAGTIASVKEFQDITRFTLP